MVKKLICFFIFNFTVYFIFSNPFSSKIEKKKEIYNFEGVKLAYFLNNKNACYDGDTCYFFIKEFHKLNEIVPVRFLGVDTPEIKGKCEQEKKLAIKARDFVRKTLKNAKKIDLRNITSKDKYKRLLAEVWVDNQSLSRILIEKKLGVNKKKNWCN